jgi:hypothetical protein
MQNSEAIVVLPAALGDSVRNSGLSRWLARGDLQVQDEPQEMLSSVLQAMALPAVKDGFAALRYWGQTGDRPKAWIAAADPVHIEATLDHLRLHCLWPDEWQAEELQQLLDELQAVLLDGDAMTINRIGDCAYLSGDSPLPTASLSAASLNGRDFSNDLPAGSAATRYHKLLSEIQMTMHTSITNQRRAEQNKRAINSLWIWGGGTSAEPEARDIPPLFANDSVFRGYWRSCLAQQTPWQVNLDDCVEHAPHGFVAITPDAAVSVEEHADLLSCYLRDLHRILKNSGLRQLTLVFRNGLTARLSPRQVFRFWRRDAPIFAQEMTE